MDFSEKDLKDAIKELPKKLYPIKVFIYSSETGQLLEKFESADFNSVPNLSGREEETWIKIVYADNTVSYSDVFGQSVAN